jgi:hypothetical protein
MTSRSAARLLVSALVLALTGGGCSLLISDDIPDFHCSADTPSACPSGLRCDTSISRCVSADGSMPIEDAGDEETPVIGDGGREADAGPLDLGSPCRLDGECKSKLCGTSTILTTDITSTTGPICTSPCCTSAECPSTFVCFSGGTSGNYCVPATLAKPKRQPPATGGKGAGVSCTADTECRSGLCAGMSCLDTCCVRTDCSEPTTCRLKSVPPTPPNHETWVCATPEPDAGKVPGDSCDRDEECVTNACIRWGTSQICRPPCSNTASCRTLPGGRFRSGHCLYGSSGSDLFKFCSITTADAGGVVINPEGAEGGANTPGGPGDPCTDDTECLSEYCDAEYKQCAEVCGKDSDCAGGACRPSAANTPYLRCVGKP